MALFLPLLRRAAPALATLAVAAQAPEVIEGRLRNGIRVLMVERPGSGMVRAGLFFRGGSADLAGLPPVAATLLVRAVFAELRPEDLGARPELDALLERADHLREALRIEALRRGRVPGNGEPDEHQVSLQASLQQTLERVGKLSTAADQPDLLDALGAVRREVAAEPDALVAALDLPTAALGAWADLEVRRLRSLRLTRLPQVRQDLEAGRPADDLAEGLLLESALPGLPYGRVLEPGRQAGVLLADLKRHGREALSPARLAIVLAGDLRSAEAQKLLETTFGTLEGAEAAEPGDSGLDGSRRPGARRVQVRAAGPPQLRMGWTVPPVTHPDRLPLEVLAQLLGRRSGGQGLALAAFLGATARLGVPGGRLENLFVVAAQPEEGRGLVACEQEIQRTLLRLQQEVLTPDAFEGALRRLELAALEAQADPALLVRRLGLGWCQGGDWRVAFPDLRGLRREGPGAIARVARTYLGPDAATLVFVEPDLAQDPGDAGQAELFHLLRAQALARLNDPVKAEALALQSMQQLRMLSREQREQVLQVLKQAGRRP